MKIQDVTHDCDTPSNFPEEAHGTTVKMKCAVCGSRWLFRVDRYGRFHKERSTSPTRKWKKQKKREALAVLEARDWENRYDDEMV